MFIGLRVGEVDVVKQIALRYNPLMEKKLINARITKSEFAILAAYAKKEGRTKTDVIRELIRSLEKLEEKDAKCNSDIE